MTSIRVCDYAKENGFVIMPLFSGVISNLQARFEEARISDLNYELGKFVQDTKCYLSRQSNSLGLQRANSKVPKSQSVPAFPHSRSFIFGGSSSKTDHNVTTHEKFVYRSSLRPPSEEDIIGSCDEDIEEEADLEASNNSATADVVEKFIRVVESSSTSAKEAVTTTAKTREDIRRKLAFAQTDNCNRKGVHNNDLEVCFINDLVDKEDLDQPATSLPRSKSECVSIASSAFKPKSEEEGTNYATVAYKLARCKQDAKRKMNVEKRNRKFHEVNSFNQLIGKSIEGDLTQEVLSQMNTATLQVIVNDFHNKIEKLNEELVDELMHKDELQVCITSN